MWTSNPGYIVRDGPKMASTTHKDFVYDDEEVWTSRMDMKASRPETNRKSSIDFIFFVIDYRYILFG
jgi:hypothetical protein